MTHMISFVGFLAECIIQKLTTEALLIKIAEVRSVSVSTLKAGILDNILNFLYQPVIAQPDMWSNVFEFAKQYSRKSTDMSVLCRHVEYFTTTTEPPINLSKSDFAIVRIVTVTMQHMLSIWVVQVTGNLGCNR